MTRREARKSALDGLQIPDDELGLDKLFDVLRENINQYGQLLNTVTSATAVIMAIEGILLAIALVYLGLPSPKKNQLVALILQFHLPSSAGDILRFPAISPGPMVCELIVFCYVFVVFIFIPISRLISAQEWYAQASIVYVAGSREKKQAIIREALKRMRIRGRYSDAAMALSISSGLVAVTLITTASIVLGHTPA